MKNIRDNIDDNELRVLVPRSSGGGGKKPSTLLNIAVAIGAVLIAVAAFIFWPKAEAPDAIVPEVFDPSAETIANPDRIELPEILGDYSDTTKAYTETFQLTVNDIPLDIYIPHNATPTLRMGRPKKSDEDIVMVTQAADIRADNGKINGAYVLAGKPLCWGLSKKGYVSIIEGKVTVGVSENSPLFEEATEKEGYFFRQYALVDNGRLVENEPKNKAVRKALCERNGETFVVMSATKESFHDFAQALVDMGIRNAVYLVGSSSLGFYRDSDGQLTDIYAGESKARKNENYIQWKK